MFENKQLDPLGQFSKADIATFLEKYIHDESTSENEDPTWSDDAAVLANGTIIAQDVFLEHVHFDLIYTPLKHLGYKAVTACISNICAMNGTPKLITMVIALSSKYTLQALEEITIGAKAACKTYLCQLAKIDITTIPKGMHISVSGIGEADPQNITRRKGAKEGDLICVSGDLGGAYAGLQLLEREKRIFTEHPNMQPDLSQKDYVLGRQLRPEARLDVIELLHEMKILPTAMLDTTEGLASDLFHLCKASNIGVKIFEDKLPIDQMTYDTALEFNLDPTLFVLNGGEDYELLFTIPQAEYDKVKTTIDISVIGYCTPAHEGKTLITKSGNEHELVAQGWQKPE